MQVICEKAEGCKDSACGHILPHEQDARCEMDCGNPAHNQCIPVCPDKVESKQDLCDTCTIQCGDAPGRTQSCARYKPITDCDSKLYGHPKFYEIMDELKKLHSDKNHDYAGTDDPLRNLKACERIQVRCPHCDKTHTLEPWIGVLIRLQDKLSRLESLAGADPKVKGESIIDTMNDMSVYAILGRILKEC